MRKLRALWIRLRCLIGSKADDFNAELQSHLQMHIEDNLRRGMTPEQARREALIKLGGMEQTRQAYRERQSLPRVESLWQDIRFGLRMLWKTPGFTITAVLTLALGIGANTAILSVVKAVLMAPLPYKDPSRIVAIWTASPARGNQALPSSPGDFAIWKKSGIFEDLAPSYDDEKTLTGHGSPQFLIGYAVTANYLRILGVQPQLGRLYTDEEDKPNGPKVVLLSNHLWRATFASDPNILGKTITLDGKPFTVLGVMPPTFDYPAAVDLWNPAAFAPSDYDDFNRTYVRILGRLRPGITLEAAQKEINALEAQTALAHPSTDNGNRIVLVPIRQQLDGDIRKPLLILLGAVGLVLLIACANTAGLALARNAERQKEISVRLALGATRMRLLRQFVTENLLLASMGGAAGILLALAGTRLLLTLFPNDVANLQMDGEGASLTVLEERDCGCDPICALTLAGSYTLHRRRAARDRQQRRRTGAQSCRSWKEELPVRGIGLRRGTRCCHVHPDRLSQAQRTRSGTLPPHGAGSDRRSSHQPDTGSAVLENGSFTPDPLFSGRLRHTHQVSTNKTSGHFIAHSTAVNRDWMDAYFSYLNQDLCTVP